MQDRTFNIEIVEGLIKQPENGRRQLMPDEIVVTMARLDEAAESEQRSTLLGLLSDEEKERLARFHFGHDRYLFLVAHALLRITLSRHEDVEPQAWGFRKGCYGRPEIAEPPSRLRFSLSRRNELAACAVILDHNIGLDVEYISNDAPIEVAERFFSEREKGSLLKASIDARAGQFLEYWTLKEAYVKARGLGLSLPPDQFSFEKGADGKWRIVSDAPLYEDSERWRFWSWRVAGSHRMALAIDQIGRADRTA